MAIARYPGNDERELTSHQRGLVDSSFEEGQYESAISVLDELRVKRHKPFPPHIRQLVFIALYPPPPPEAEQELDITQDANASPSKIMRRRSKSSLAPSAEASAMARDVLATFARTCAPDAVACALPSYPQAGAPPPDPDLEDSYIAKQALRIQNARCVWDILREGFIVRPKAGALASPKKGALRRMHKDEGPDRVDGEPPAPVGEAAWAVLGCFLTLCERDEAAVEQAGQPRYSPILLAQIPPKTGALWDAEAALDVAFYALQREDCPSHMAMGARLLGLLINLTGTTFVEQQKFLGSLPVRLFSLPHEEALTVLELHLPQTRAAAQYKVSLCKNYLTDNTGAVAHSKARAKPQPRPAPSRRRGQADDYADPVEEGSGKTVARKYAVTPPAELLELLARPCGAGDLPPMTFLRLKAVLLTNYAAIQRYLADEGERDTRWDEVLATGALRQTIEAAFTLAGKKDRGAAEDLKEIFMDRVLAWGPGGPFAAPI